ncbi:hypothetical protein Slin15195_G024600 [Septoria linicola]|uniref:Uncharacterized protein n=1 Tax=Septoria linicola TaxID=215465 RepID=A0A9Q9EET6_9PEZI|nr:hypothetical protein Slin14017_G023690 [Septoria linicola]USW49141.1 hypothetical protein Slin15195_G024600 [Septoria linicola]
MGIVISTTQYAPFPLVTGIIGIISFVFTLTTWLKVLWTNFETMGQAPHEVHAYLTNIRTELLEERASIRLMRKQCKKYHKQVRQDGGDSLLGMELDEATLKTMQDAIKYLIRRFQDIERPSLEPGGDGIAEWEKHERQRRKRRNDSVSPYYEQLLMHRRPTKKAAGPNQEPEVGEGAEVSKTRVTMMMPRHSGRKEENLKLRDLFATLGRVQIRRIARQVGGLSVLAHEYGAMTDRTESMLRRMEDRLTNIVGVRRID